MNSVATELKTAIAGVILDTAFARFGPSTPVRDVHPGFSLGINGQTGRRENVVSSHEAQSLCKRTHSGGASE